MKILRLLRPRAAMLVLLAALPLIAGACQSATGPDAGDRGDLAAARQRWQATGLTTYTYTVRPACYCGGPSGIIITVQNGAVTSRTDAETGQPIPAGQFARLGTVEDLFAVVQDAIERGAHSIDSTYDASTGVPLNVFIDYSENVADEEFGFSTTAMSPSWL